MSLRRNNRLLNRGDTIVRTSPVPLTDGLTTSYYTNRFVKIKNKYYTPSQNNWYNSAENTIVIKAEIPENATGYFFGVFSSTQAMTIRKDGTNIKWKIGTAEYTRAWQPGVHLYGFSEGKAWYDNVFLSTTPYTGGLPASKITIGGAANIGSSTTYECISEIDVYEVFMAAPYTNGATTKTVGRLYAARAGAGGTKAWLFEIRRSLYAWDSYGAGTVSLGDAVTYGIQLHDLKEAFGSGYRDLVAMMAEDNPSQAAADADPAYTVKKGTEEHKFAFLLRDHYNTSTPTLAPLPADYKHEGETGGAPKPDRPMTRAVIGELIYGRRPKWKLWADNINVGKHAVEFNGLFQYIYNIYQPYNGQGRPNLEQWEGYTTGNEYAPGFELTAGTYEIEYHNGVPCRCGENQRLRVYGYSGEMPDLRDNIMVFLYEPNAASGKVKAKLGNLINWHLTPQQQEINDLVFGMACIIRHGVKYDEEFIYSPVAAAYIQTKQAAGAEEIPTYSAELMPLSSKSNAETINMFKYGKLADGVTDAEIDLALTGKNATRLYRDLAASVDNIIDVKAVLAAIRSSVTLTSPPDNAGLVFTDHVVPIPSTKLHGVIDTKIYSGTNYRCLLMDGGQIKVNSTIYYAYPVLTAANGTQTLFLGDQSGLNKGFAFAFVFLDDAWTASCNMVESKDIVQTVSGDTITPHMFIAIETASIYLDANNNEVYTKGKYCKPLGMYDQSDSNPATGSLLMITSTYLPNGTRAMANTTDVKNNLVRQWFPKADIPAMFNGDTILQNTTVKVWLRHENDPRVLVKYAEAIYHSKADAWKLSYLTKSRLFIDGTQIEIDTRKGLMVVKFSSWNVSGDEQAGTETYTPRPLDTTIDSKRLKVSAYGKWDDVNILMCSATFRINGGTITREATTANWDIEMYGSGHSTNDPNTGDVFDVSDYGYGPYSYEIAIAPTYGTSAQWTTPFAYIKIEATT